MLVRNPLSVLFQVRPEAGVDGPGGEGPHGEPEAGQHVRSEPVEAWAGIKSQ